MPSAFLRGRLDGLLMLKVKALFWRPEGHPALQEANSTEAGILALIIFDPPGAPRPGMSKKRSKKAPGMPPGAPEVSFALGTAGANQQ